MAEKVRELYISIPNPGFNKDGELEAAVQLWQKHEPDDRQLWRKKIRLQHEGERLAAAKELTELGFEGADAELNKKASEAYALVTNGKAVKPMEHRIFGDWSRQVIATLSHQARWILTPQGKTFWMNGTNQKPVDLRSRSMATLIYDKFGVTGSDKFFNYVLDAMDAHTRLRGEEVTLQELAYYDAKQNKLVLDQADGNVLVLDGGDPVISRNGAEGVLFKQTHLQQPWRYLPKKDRPRRKKGEPSFLSQLLSNFSFVAGEHSPLSVEEQQLMLQFWVISLLFRSAQKVKPIALAVGDTGSGKSTMFRIIGRMLYGPDWDLKRLDSQTPKDFDVAVSNNLLLGLDNLDTKIKWLEDSLCVAADGVIYSRRILHTTNEEGTFKPDCFIALTARTPEFRRRDVAGRMLIWHLAPRTVQKLAVVPEPVLYGGIEKMRDVYMSELADMCTATLKIGPPDANDSPIRSADHWAIVKRIGTAMGYTDRAFALYAKVKETQQQFATEQHPFVLAAVEWLALPNNAGRPVSAAELYRELKAIADKSGFEWECKNHKSMGMQIRELGGDGALAKYFNIKRDRARATIYVLTPLDWDNRDQLIPDTK